MTFVEKESLFDSLQGYKRLPLNDDLTPIETGYTDKLFQFAEVENGSNYGLVGGSQHRVEERIGLFCLIDFDIKRKLPDGTYEIVKEWEEELDEIKETKLRRPTRYSAISKSQGEHTGILVRTLPPQTNGEWISKKSGMPVDIRPATGYCVAIAPNYVIVNIPKNYEKIYETLDDFMNEIGFIKKGGLIVSKSDVSKYDFEDLMKGKFVRGERRAKLRSLYIKLRNKGLTCDLAELQVRKTNDTCEEPIAEEELENNIPSAEKFFQDLEIDFQTKAQFSGESKIDLCADALLPKYNFKTIMQDDKILVFDGKFYNEMQAEPLIKEEVENLIPNCKMNYVNEAIAKIKRKTYVDITKFDSDDNLTILENGILHFDTLQITPHDPDYLGQIKLPVSFTPQPIGEDIFADIEANLKDTLFYQAMKNSFTINGEFQRESFETILEIASSFLIKHSIDERHFMCIGGGENGKGVFFDFVELMIGSENLTHNTLHGLSQDRFLVAELDGKLGNIFTDLEDDELKHTGIIKAVGSNEPMTVQRKYGQPYKMRPHAKLMFSCNRFPKVYDQTQGFFRRWIIVKWERSFENDELRNVNLKHEIALRVDETDKIFSTLVYLAKNLLKRGTFTNTPSWKKNKSDWNENADPLEWFVNSHIIDSDGNKSKRDTYQFYKKIMLEKGENPLGYGQFGKMFAEYREGGMLNDISTGGRTKWVWYNIGFKESKQAKLGDTFGE